MRESSSSDHCDAPERAWAALREVLRRELSEVTFHIWLAPLEPVALSGGTLYLRAPDHIRTWVAERYGAMLRDGAVRADVARAVEVVHLGWTASGGGDAQFKADLVGDGLNPRYTFDRFVICDENRLAHAAALAVAELPSQAYNPLFIHGRPGLGKTHLLHAIGNYVQSYGLGLTVRYATVEEFTTEFITAVRAKQTGAFRDRFRGANVLLVDDIQFLAEKLRTEEEFFHTFNALYEAGSQLVITSDRRPRDIIALETRLRERFEHGLVAELEAPSFDARLAILQKRARLDAVSGVSDAVLAEVALHVTSSVRTLEGALIRVVAYASLRGETTTPELARQVLQRLYPREGTAVSTLEEIKRAAAEVFDISPEAIVAQDRRAPVALARQVAMYMARELTEETFPAIGRGFGGRNHSTVVHAHRRISEQIGRDKRTADAVDALRAHLSRASGDRP
ncbi:MAG: chromosomal replication initiator protein DnaA [Thermoleophilaceae bacterium]